MDKRLVILGGYLVNPGASFEGYATLLIKDGIVEKIIEKDTDLPTEYRDVEKIDATGLYIFPGLVDAHSHFRDPGFTHKEDILTGAAAAMAGGYTDIVLMCNTKPVVDNEETFRYVVEKGKTTPIHIHSCATVTMGLKGQELTDMEALAKLGAVGFTDDGIPLMDAEILTKAMEESARLGLPISLHEEDKNLIENNGINRGKASEFYGIGGSPKEAEISLLKETWISH